MKMVSGYQIHRVKAMVRSSTKRCKTRLCITARRNWDINASYYSCDFIVPITRGVLGSVSRSLMKKGCLQEDLLYVSCLLQQTGMDISHDAKDYRNLEHGSIGDRSRYLWVLLQPNNRFLTYFHIDRNRNLLPPF